MAMAKTPDIPSPATKTAGAAAVEELVVGTEERLPLVAVPVTLPLVMVPNVELVEMGVSPRGIDMTPVSDTLGKGTTGARVPVVIGKIRISSLSVD